MRRLSVGLWILVLLLCASSPAHAMQAKAAKSKTAATISTPVNINTATAAQLEALPGVSAKTARLIVEERQKNGGFKKIEELMNIKGIGEKSFLKLKPMVTVGGEKADKP